MKTPLIPCKREKNKNPKTKIIKKTVTPKTNCRQISTNLILKSSNMNKIQIHIKNSLSIAHCAHHMFHLNLRQRSSIFGIVFVVVVKLGL